MMRPSNSFKVPFMKRLLLAALLSCSVAHLPASAQGDSSNAVSQVSALPVWASVFVVAGSLIGAGPVIEASVESVEASGEAVVVVLKKAGDGSLATLRLSGKGAGHASLAVGTAVTATTTASGIVLSAAGRVLAFLPNEMGKSLLHHARTGA